MSFGIKDLEKGMYIGCNKNNYTNDVGKKFLINSIDIREGKIYVKGDRSIFYFEPFEIDWELTAKLNGIVLEIEKDKEKYRESLRRNGDTEEEVKRKVETVFSNEKIEGLKLDQGKLRYDLLPFGAVDQLVRVLTYGAEKYAPNNWRLVENPIERYKAATLRHLSLYMQGEEVDKESGISHLAHAATNVIFLMEFEKEKFDMKLNEQELINFLKEGSKK